MIPAIGLPNTQSRSALTSDSHVLRSTMHVCFHKHGGNNPLAPVQYRRPRGNWLVWKNIRRSCTRENNILSLFNQQLLPCVTSSSPPSLPSPLPPELSPVPKTLHCELRRARARPPTASLFSNGAPSIVAFRGPHGPGRYSRFLSAAGAHGRLIAGQMASSSCLLTTLACGRLPSGYVPRPARRSVCLMECC